MSIRRLIFTLDTYERCAFHPFSDKGENIVAADVKEPCPWIVAAGDDADEHAEEIREVYCADV